MEKYKPANPPVTNSKLDLGAWQRVFYPEFDVQRKKRAMVKVHG